ncbi:MAG: RAMP superfamily protein [Acidobacteria bacterium]|nr:RAMP superfamily protein [Acidobacteriota bacterium]
MQLWIHLKLKSDTTLGRGDGVSGLVDQEIEYDKATGLPYLRGRTLKGLLVEECSNIFFALKQQSIELKDLKHSAQKLFGESGSSLSADGTMHIGAAQFPPELVKAIKEDIKAHKFTTNDILESLTTIRRQTSINPETGSAAESSLRSIRVLIRETLLMAPLVFEPEPNPEDKALLAACIASLRHLGSSRNRGHGQVCASLHSDGKDITLGCLADFRKLVEGKKVQ